MMPIGPLMHEHRLIEAMLKKVEEEIRYIRKTNCLRPAYIDVVVDFIRTYADRTHHGKEEDILFKFLEGKSMPLDNQQIMADLIAEHSYFRETTGRLVQAKNSYKIGDESGQNEVLNLLSELVMFYPKHIEKEDKKFFYTVMVYFTEKEQQNILDAFWEFDRRMIHEKYIKVVESMDSISV